MNKKPPIELEAVTLPPEFAELNNEAQADTEQAEPAAEPAEPEAPPVDPRAVAMVAAFIGALGKTVAPRWLAIIQKNDAEAARAGVEAKPGVYMVAEALVPVLEQYAPNLQASPLLNLAVVCGLVFAPCVGEPLRDPEPPVKKEPTGTERTGPGGGA